MMTESTGDTKPTGDVEPNADTRPTADAEPTGGDVAPTEDTKPTGHDVAPTGDTAPTADDVAPIAADVPDRGISDAGGAAGTLGDDRVDAAVRQLDGLEQLDVHDHAARYDRAQEELHGALDDETTAPDRP